MKYQRPKGTADILPNQSSKWQFVEDNARQLFAKYCYQEIRTPIFENFDVFSRTSGETSDIITKEMYDFYDKGDRHITLRPEGTAGVVRAFVENKLFAPEVNKPCKLYYMGPMFRYERPQAGRLREFHQIGIEAFGCENPALDAEVISMALELLAQLGIKNIKLALNTLGDNESRQAYRQALIDYLTPLADQLSNDSKQRLEKNPLRILDSKEECDQAIIANAPSILDYLTPKAKEYFANVKSLLDALEISYEIDSNMVRGLDYYNHTIFEIMSNDQVFDNKWTTICGGGRYSGLVEQLGGPEMPGIGFGIGVERLLLVLENLELANPLDVYVVSIGEQTQIETFKLVQSLRKQGFVAEKDYLERKIKAQFKTADKLKARYTLTLGESELETGKINLKDMQNGEEHSVNLADVYADFAKILKD